LRLASPLADALNAGEDAHCRLGARMAGVSYAEFFERYKGGDPAYKNYRQAAKPGNFGYGGGMGPPKFVFTQRNDAQTTRGPDGREYKGIRFCLILGVAERCGEVMIREWNGNECTPVCKKCTDIAADLRAAFVTEWNMRPYFDVASKISKGTREVCVPPLNRIRGGCSFTQAANSFFQGLAADGMKHAFWNVSRECYTDESSPMYGARPLVCIHDELFSTMRIEQADRAARRLSDVMVESMRLFCPDVLVKAEPALMPRWYKGAEAVYTDEGKLTAWYPGGRFRDAKGKPVEIRLDAQ
jgi:hypothetical protein